MVRVKGLSVFDGVKARMKSLKEENLEKDRQIKVLEHAVEAACKREKESVKVTMTAGKERMTTQKKEYEVVIQRHLSFVDRLLKDKEDLHVKCQDFAHGLDEMEQKWIGRMEEAKKDHERYLKQNKDAWAQAEKIRRETWIDEKTKHIKAMTIKGLEPEIQRLIAQQKQDMQRVETRHSESLRHHAEQGRFETEKLIQTVRSALLKEKEVEMAKDREIAAMRLREQIERYDKSMITQRERFNEEIERERQRLRDSHKLERAKLQKELGSYKRHDEDRYREVREGHKQEMEQTQQRGEHALAKQKDREKIEREVWQKQMASKLRDDMMQQFEEERDAEIDLVIEKLGQEGMESEQKLQERHTRQVVMIKKKHEMAASKLKSQAQQLSERFIQLSADHVALGKKFHALESTSSSRQLSLTEQQKKIKELSDGLLEARQQLTVQHEQSRKQFSAEIEALQRTVKIVDQKQTEREKEYDEEVRVLQGSHETRVMKLQDSQKEAMSALEARVRATLAKKDGVLNQFRLQLEEKDVQFRQLNSMFQQQREELMELQE